MFIQSRHQGWPLTTIILLSLVTAVAVAKPASHSFPLAARTNANAIAGRNENHFLSGSYHVKHCYFDGEGDPCTLLVGTDVLLERYLDFDNSPAGLSLSLFTMTANLSSACDRNQFSTLVTVASRDPCYKPTSATHTTTFLEVEPCTSTPLTPILWRDYKCDHMCDVVEKHIQWYQYQVPDLSGIVCDLECRYGDCLLFEETACKICRST